MATLILRRLLAVIPMLILVSFGVFMLITLVPGDAAVTIAGGDNATPERIAEVREQLGLNDPLLVQYGSWLGDAARLDFGDSLLDNRPVVDEIKSRFPVTFSIAIAALVVGLAIGVPAGIIAGMRPGSFRDRVSVVGASTGLAVPSFWLAMILITIFAVNLRWLPAVGFTRFTDSPTEWLKSVILPAFSLGVLAAAVIARQLRASLIDVMGSSYVRTAWAKGGSATRVVGKHASKNAAIPTVTVVGILLGTLIGGGVIIEQIFSIPGLGSYLIRSVIAFDVPVVQAVTLVFAVVQITMMLLVDISYGFLNPKVRVS